MLVLAEAMPMSIHARQGVVNGIALHRRPIRNSQISFLDARRSRTIGTTSFDRSRQQPRPIRCSDSDASSSSVLQDLGDAVAEGLGGINIYLVGMMGSGKTTVGSILAKNMRYVFMDSDDLIEKAAKCSIEEIFAANGEEDFRTLETSVLRDLHQYTKLVVGTGGGIVIKQENWGYLHQGVVVFLNGSPEKLAPRVAKDGLSGRPLLSKTEGEAEMNAIEVATEKLQRIYSERERMYKSADIEVSLEDSTTETGLASVDEVVQRILMRLSSKIEEGRRKRQKQQQFEVKGTATTPEGKSTINTPPNEI